MLRSSPAVGFGCNRGFLWTHTHSIITRPTINITIVLSFFNRLWHLQAIQKTGFTHCCGFLLFLLMLSFARD